MIIVLGCFGNGSGAVLGWFGGWFRDGLGMFSVWFGGGFGMAKSTVKSSYFEFEQQNNPFS